MVAGLHSPGIWFPEGLICCSPSEDHRCPCLWKECPAASPTPTEGTWEEARPFFSSWRSTGEGGCLPLRKFPLPTSTREGVHSSPPDQSSSQLSSFPVWIQKQIEKLQLDPSSAISGGIPGPCPALLPCPLLWKEEGSVPSGLTQDYRLGLWLSP